MSTELDNQKNLDIESKPTEEINNDLDNSAESEANMPLNQDNQNENSSDLKNDDLEPISEQENDSTAEIREELVEDTDSPESEVNKVESLNENDSSSNTNTDLENAILQLQSELESLNKKLENQQAENKSIQGQYMRLNADFENYRRRTVREKEDLEQQIKRKTLSEILSVVDNFERARTQIKPANDGEMVIHKSYQGVYKTLVDSLKRLGVSAMRPEGELFDPNYHEAMLREPTNEHPEGTVLEQLVRGYLLHDQVLRHAMVKVATPKDEEESEQSEEPSESIAEDQS